MTYPHHGDLPDDQELRGTFGSRKRSGVWVVPRTLRLRTRMGSTELDFTQATFVHDRLDISLQVFGGSIELRVPADAVVDMDAVTINLGSLEDHRRNQPGQGSLHIVISGTLTWGSLEIRGPR